MSLGMRKLREKVAFGLLRLAMLVVVGALGSILFYVLWHGAGAISWEFLSQPPRDSMTKGGIFPAIMGTLWLTVGALLVALPLGVAAAIYLSEYAKEGKTLAVVRLGIANLAGVPSVVFGLFGLGLFVVFFKMGVSLLAGSLTLGLLILPTVIGASEEAMRQVPGTFREASLALGATRWQTIRKVVLPAALPGILTGVILSVGRVAGETAPILFTAAAFYVRGYPHSPFSEVMALPYHIYALMTEGTHPEEQTRIAYGASLLLMGLVLSVSMLAIWIRQRQRKTYHA